MENLLDGKLAMVPTVVAINANQCPEYVSLTENISTTKRPIEWHHGGFLYSNMLEFKRKIARSSFRPKFKDLKKKTVGLSRGKAGRAKPLPGEARKNPCAFHHELSPNYWVEVPTFYGS